LKYTLGNTFTGNRADARAFIVTEHSWGVCAIARMRDLKYTLGNKYLYWKSRRITEDVCIRCGKVVMILAAETMSHIYAAETK